MSGWVGRKGGGRGYPPRVSDEGRVLWELSSFMDPNLGEVAAAPEPDVVSLDAATVALAEQVARPPWYASWIGAVVILVLPILLTVAGGIGGDANLTSWGIGGILFLFIRGFPLLAVPSLGAVLGYCDARPGIRHAIAQQRAASVL